MTVYEKAEKLMNATLSTYASSATNPFFGEVSEWKFSSRHCGKNYFGLCNLMHKEIMIDQRVMEYGTWDEIKEIVLHECAHALAGLEYSPRKNIMAHGKLWRTWAKRLGCNPRAKTTLSPSVMEHYVLKVKKPKYHIISIIEDKVTVHGHAGRTMKNLKHRHYPSVKNSLGNLYLIETVLFDKATTTDDIKKYAFR